MKNPIEDKSASADTGDHWQLDKRIPIALIILLITQSFGIIWWGAKLDSRLEVSTTEIAALNAWKESQSSTQSKTESRLAVIEERMSEQSETLHHIDDRLEKAFTPPRAK